jgi:hypothetical protein
MKTAYALILTLPLILGCVSSKQLLRERRYDMAIAKSVEKLSDDPGNAKEIPILAKAYICANNDDNDRIKYLKQSKEPQVWEEVYVTYTRLKGRQDLVRPLDASVLQAINYTYIDYDQDLIDSKKRASDFLYGEGKTFLAKNNRFDAREAYDRFTKVKEYLPAYPGIDDKINEAFGKGFTYVYFKVQNSSNKALPRAFEEDLLKVGLKDQSSRHWLNFDTRFDGRIRYDYCIVLNFRKIEITPELSASNDFVESKEVDDGWEYVMDLKGNVTKDSLGNDRKKAKRKTLKCYVSKFSLGKNVTVGATLDFVDNASGQIIKTDPLSASSKFEFVYASAKGDQEALTPETRKLTSLKLAPFPTNEEMLLRTADSLKHYAKGIIFSNLHLLK